MDYEQQVAAECGGEIRRIDTNGISTDALVAGSGPAMLLLHGWPHTWLIWQAVLPALAARHTVVAPDLRGLGAATRPDCGYDPHTLADDAAGVLDAVGLERAVVVGLDAGAPAAWMLARRHPERVARLVVMESLMGRLPGAEAFLAAGAPWWFGFHAVTGLAERVLAGHEAEYLDFFFDTGTHAGRGLPTDLRDAIVARYQESGALRGGFEHYRAMPLAAEQIAAAAMPPSQVPTVAIAGGVVGDALHRQLAPVTDHLTAHTIADCGHIIPVDRPHELLGCLLEPHDHRGSSYEAAA